ncbi:hypothetical protein PR048_001725 [Dryococelus australis]|uniref:Uncharacterized protein n=1 Tax=Dryococelus australis TaxID=614101 RepID=A0ABQ9IIB4_9NEOP|nr:hypothetical protein PR048_001725 [Dryococelus australis]
MQLVTMLLLATSALTEVVLVGAYTAAVVQSFQKGLPLEGWRAGARLLRRLLQETRAPCWLVLLVAGVLLVQAPLLYKLCSNYFSSFRSWYLGTITVTLLRLPHHENAPPPVHNQ